MCYFAVTRFHLILTFLSGFQVYHIHAHEKQLKKYSRIYVTYMSKNKRIVDQDSENEILFNIKETKIEIGHNKSIILATSKALSEAVDISFNYQIGTDETIKSHFSDNLISELNNVTLYPSNDTSSATLYIHAKTAGHVSIGVNNNSKIGTDNFILVIIEHSAVLNIITVIIGWLYFALWTVSFYPQVILNFRRKSVIGLNFDFLAYNITGFIDYSIFNVGLYWIPAIQKIYFENDPRGVNPVQLNDVGFALHAAFITAVTILQCFIYERGQQAVSLTCKIIFSMMWLFSIIILVLGFTNVLNWLQFISYLSYNKLLVTLIKYIPQVHMHWKIKSTDGWSIWTTNFDIVGGIFSMLQMFLLSYNNDDWNSIFGDPTKFGLAALSVFFDSIIMLQHYVLYREVTKFAVKEDHELKTIS